MKYRRWLSLPILVVLSSAVQAGTSTNVMTRQNQADLNCAITVQVRTNAVQNWYTFTVSVPKEDTRLVTGHSKCTTSGRIKMYHPDLCS